MAEVKNEDEVQQQQQHAHGIPPKRKTDLTSVDEDRDENGQKMQRLEHSADKICSSPAVEKKIDGEDEEDDDEEDYEEEDDEDEDEDDEDQDFYEEHSNGQVVEVDRKGVVEVDRKGKGILREDKKGKGKLVQESDDDSSDDGGGGVESDGGDSSDLSEDPLAEVDLDNILPSRTRRRGTFHPGLCLSKNHADGRDD